MYRAFLSSWILLQDLDWDSGLTVWLIDSFLGITVGDTFSPSLYRCCCCDDTDSGDPGPDAGDTGRHRGPPPDEPRGTLPCHGPADGNTGFWHQWQNTDQRLVCCVLSDLFWQKIKMIDFPSYKIELSTLNIWWHQFPDLKNTYGYINPSLVKKSRILILDSVTEKDP